MSPMQGALIAATIVNDGVMMEPFAVDSIHALDGTALYEAEPAVKQVAVSPQAAREVRALMRATVKKGTSRGAFRGFFRKANAGVDVGGKTGSLTGLDPKGKYDWFVGFADNGEHKIAVASLTINEKAWRVKSSYVARRAFEMYFADKFRRATPDKMAQAAGRRWSSQDRD
jgi:cell division protein FtsI/penicillin-binding protein 2